MDSISQLSTQIADAVAQHNWALLSALIAAAVIPLTLAALGKNVPLVSTVLQVIVSMLSKNKPQPPAAPVESPKGVLSVVKVEPEKKPEEK